MPRRISEEGRKMIQQEEGYIGHIYLCPAGVKTIGFGHALRQGEDERFKNGITKDQADQLLTTDLAHAESAVTRLIKVPLNDTQFVALVDFTFNLGAGALQRSTLRSKLNRSEYINAAYEFPKWCYGGGKKLLGLYRRRIREMNLFLLHISYA